MVGISVRYPSNGVLERLGSIFAMTVVCPAVANPQALYCSHHGWLNTWLRARLGNAADAADLAQDTFVRLLQKTERLELKAPRTFLRTIARGLVIDHWRREEIELAYLETIAHLPEDETPSTEARALVLELLESIARMLEGLKPKVRQAFLLAQCVASCASLNFCYLGEERNDAATISYPF